MKLSRFLAEHTVNKDDFSVNGICAGKDAEDYKAVLDAMSDDIAEGIIKYQEYLKGLDTARYSVAIHELQLVEALAKMEAEPKPKSICPIGKYTDKDSTIIDHTRCDFFKQSCTQACFLKLDPVCLPHGKKISEHPSYGCLYCCLCFKTLTPDECNVNADGQKEDVCKPCAKLEAEQMEALQERQEDAQMRMWDWFLIGLSIITLIVICLKIWGEI